MFNVYNLENIPDSEDKSILPLEGSSEIPYTESMSGYNYDGYKFLSNPAVSFFVFSNPTDILTISSTTDESNLLGIEYKGQFFTQIKPELLSAGGADVRAGKTFIGWSGVVETGTLEVEG